MMEIKYSWGDVVLIKHYSANDENLLGKVGSVCGVTAISNQILSDKYKLSIGSSIYTVELDDGNAYGIPASDLERNDE
jgi:hypothetical protein